MADERIRCRVIVHGRVQGVWSRHTTRRQALANRIDGWVRNRPDGTVEAVLEGATGDVQAMLQFLRQGPPGADVIRLEVSDEPPEGVRSFSIR
jgi:acylphosphatase